MIWNRLKHDSIRRVSGLKYLSSLLKQPDFYQPGGSFWIMASEESARRNCAWLRRQGIELAPADQLRRPALRQNNSGSRTAAADQRAPPPSYCRDPGWRHAGTARPLFEKRTQLQAIHPLCWRGYCFPERRPGHNSDMGRPDVPGMAVSLSLGSPPLHAPLLGCAQAALADDPLWQQPSGFPQECRSGHGRIGNGPQRGRYLKKHPIDSYHLAVSSCLKL